MNERRRRLARALAAPDLMPVWGAATCAAIVMMILIAIDQ
jgi:hypothetical protein